MLGFAGPEWGDPATCTITEGVAFLNGPSFGDAVEALDVLVHEFGHYQNLAHTVVNGQIVLGDHTGPSPFDTITFPIPPLVRRSRRCTRFTSARSPAHLRRTRTTSRDSRHCIPRHRLPPEGADGGSYHRLERHDQVDRGQRHRAQHRAIRSTTRCRRSRATTRSLTAVVAVCRRLHDSRADTRCEIRRATWTRYWPEVSALRLPTPLPGPEEFYNAPNETNDRDTDNPAVFTPVLVIGGLTMNGINIIFNTFRPGEALPVGDDGSVELALPFRFDVCGQSFESVFVNANGSLTFGAPSRTSANRDSSSSTVPPRAAGIWRDLNPSAAGAVTFAQTDQTFTVSWSNVPEFTPAEMADRTRSRSSCIAGSIGST